MGILKRLLGKEEEIKVSEMVDYIKVWEYVEERLEKASLEELRSILEGNFSAYLKQKAAWVILEREWPSGIYPQEVSVEDLCLILRTSRKNFPLRKAAAERILERKKEADIRHLFHVIMYPSCLTLENRAAEIIMEREPNDKWYLERIVEFVFSGPAKEKAQERLKTLGDG